MKGFSITRGSNIFSIRSDTFCQHQLENYFGYNSNPLVRNLGYNSNSTQNQNVFHPTAGNLLGVSSVYIKFSNESIPLAY